MQCEQVRSMMSERLDDRLDSAECALLDDHWAACSACRSEWHKLQVLDHLLASASMAQSPVRVRVRVMTRLHRRERARRALFGGATLTLGTVALAMLALIPVFLGLLNMTGAAPALVGGGPETLAQLLAILRTMSRTSMLLLKSIALPIAFLGLCGLVITLTLNGLWIGAVRYVRALS